MVVHPLISDTKAIKQREQAPGEYKNSKITGRKHCHRDRMYLPSVTQKSGNVNDSSSGSNGSNHQHLMVDGVVLENDKQVTVTNKKRLKQKRQDSSPTTTEPVPRSFSNTVNDNIVIDKAPSPRIAVSPMSFLSDQAQLEHENLSLFTDHDSGTDSNAESPFMPQLELPKNLNYYSPFLTGFDFGVTPAYDAIESNATSNYSSKMDHDLVSQMAGWKNKALLSGVFSLPVEEVDMIHETSISNFMNQVDTEATAFFSKHLDVNYKH